MLDEQKTYIIRLRKKRYHTTNILNTKNGIDYKSVDLPIGI